MATTQAVSGATTPAVGTTSHSLYDERSGGTDPSEGSVAETVSTDTPSRRDPGRSAFKEDFSSIRESRASTILDDSAIATPASGGILSRSNTLRKKRSLSRKGSLRKSLSRRSSFAGSVRNLALEKDHDDPNGFNNAFVTPIPTQGNPTAVLADRFQAWRRVLKDFVAYFREAAASCDTRSKSLVKLASTLSNAVKPTTFLKEGGIIDSNKLLQQYYRQAYEESDRAKNIYGEIIHQLTGLRADLSLKIKEIKALSGDFKNSVEKEVETTKKAVGSLQESLGLSDGDSATVAGKGDPYIVRLGVEKQVRRQIDEENYLHRAYLNLEGSGRELEAIIVGEIQKAFDAYSKIMKREADDISNVVDSLHTQVIDMPKDKEWLSFIEGSSNLVDPGLPLRNFEDITYPGKNHPAAKEVRSGMLERKSKYLKSYTPGWYVLSPSHLHEFKSPDRLQEQTPVMSLYLPEQKLGSHSQPGSSSHKFMLKGRQAGGMHRGHSWVFRAESHETMMEWFENIKIFTEAGSGAERNERARRHQRAVSSASFSAPSVNSEMEEDEADRVPYAATPSANSRENVKDARPAPGGVFQSELSVDRGQAGPRSTTSGESDDAAVAVGSLPGHTVLQQAYGKEGNVSSHFEPPARAPSAFSFEQPITQNRPIPAHLPSQDTISVNAPIPVYPVMSPQPGQDQVPPNVAGYASPQVLGYGSPIMAPQAEGVRYIVPQAPVQPIYVQQGPSAGYVAASQPIYQSGVGYTSQPVLLHHSGSVHSSVPSLYGAPPNAVPMVSQQPVAAPVASAAGVTGLSVNPNVEGSLSEGSAKGGSSTSTNPTSVGSAPEQHIVSGQPNVLGNTSLTAEPEAEAEGEVNETEPSRSRFQSGHRQKSELSVSDLKVPGTFPQGSF